MFTLSLYVLEMSPESIWDFPRTLPWQKHYQKESDTSAFTLTLMHAEAQAFFDFHQCPKKLQHLIFLQKYKTTSLFQVWGHLLQVFVMRTEHACLPDFAICRSYQQRSVLALITQNLDSLLWRCDSFPSFFCSISIKLRQSHYCSICFWRTVCDCVSAQTLFLRINVLRSDIMNIECFSFIM